MDWHELSRAGEDALPGRGVFSGIAEFAPPERVGTMLTVQTSAGFLLTLITIHAMPYIIETLSWRYAFAILAIGPAFGVLAMLKLRGLPEAVTLAQGRR